MTLEINEPSRYASAAATRALSLAITRQELLKIRDDESESRYLCVEFSSWQYEDYEDVKVALMTTVLDAVEGRVGGDQQEQVSKLRRFAQGLTQVSGSS